MLVSVVVYSVVWWRCGDRSVFLMLFLCGFVRLEV